MPTLPSSDSLFSQIEMLSERLMRANLASEGDVRDLGVRLGAIASWTASTHATVTPAAKAAQRLLEAIARGDEDDSRAAYDVVCRTVSVLQDILVAGKDPVALAFPEELTQAQGSGGADGDECPAFVIFDEEPCDGAKRVVGGSSALPESQQIDTGLLPTFVAESREHLDHADLLLLALETDSSSIEKINALFRSIHTIKGGAGAVGLRELSQLAHEGEQLLDHARSGELKLEGAVIDAVFQTVDALRCLLDSAVDASSRGRAPPRDSNTDRLIAHLRAVGAAAGVHAGKLGEMLVQMGATSPADVKLALEKQRANPDGPKLGEILVADGAAEAKAVASALRIQRMGPTGSPAPGAREFVKVDAERLDRLVDAIGELVIAETMVSHSPDLRACEVFPRIQRHVAQMDKISRSLQEMATSLRMVPLRSTFQKMARVVRDLTKQLGKQVNLVMSGESAELDKTVVDRIGDPLVHMVRNSVDHGMELPEERRRLGKPETGRLELRARHVGNEIHVEVEDDGRGLDCDAIRARALERGLIRAGESPSDRELWDLIFEPGFSTAKHLSDVSGRGVGTDVVRKTIEELRGSVDVFSEPGRRTVFTIRLPLTLAVIDGMLVSVAGERYVVPTLSVLRTVHRPAGDIATILKLGKAIDVDGRWVPVFELRDVLGLRGRRTNAGGPDDSADRLIVVVENGKELVGLVVDQLLGQQQIVIKSLGAAVVAPGIAGGAILPDGSVGLILELGGLVRHARSRNEGTLRRICDEKHDGSSEGIGERTRKGDGQGGHEQAAE